MPLEARSSSCRQSPQCKDRHKAPLPRRFLDSFRRDPKAFVAHSNNGARKRSKLFDLAEANIALAQTPLRRKLNARHLQMIAIGGSVGTGLFVCSGHILQFSGPGSILIGFIIISIMLYSTIHALGEMAVLFPVVGSFSSYFTRFLDPAWGFAMGWNYALQMTMILPLEIVSAALTVQFWRSDISHAVWVTVVYFIIVGINLFGVRAYGEAECIFSLIKVSAIVGFIVLGIILNVADGPNGSYIGGKYWYDPGAFNHGFKGLCSLHRDGRPSRPEAVNPCKTIPLAVKQVFWRITLFYIIAISLVGLLVPFDDARLTDAKSQADANISPFVIAIRNAGIQGLDSVMNTVMMIAMISVGNSAIYGSSRTLVALAAHGQAPRFLTYIDREGRPLLAIATTAAIGLLAYMSVLKDRHIIVFNWLIAISGLSSILTWASICLAHIRFRRGWKVQGHSLDELAFRSPLGVVGSWIGAFIVVLILAAQIWIAIAPISYQEMSASERIMYAIQASTSALVALVFYVVYKYRHKTRIVRAADMDLHSGTRESNIEELLAKERAERKGWSWFRKIYRFFC
ncbi:hypothetical protein AJ80_00401 [Polytolypa hystricis UAMH7299]|uniref:Amino acid permease/ SLC12A domain-containing protein n=1 Tax=Polytolypa hystricis (strain UAMH7299) TaxID=1447883 RepID=A0A2B7Z3B4_POLH7|nr:hypothetical protein AJ80_00401 [Polytolypa hystricis UAMH7299]